MNDCPCAASRLLQTHGIFDNSMLPCSAYPTSTKSLLNLASMQPKCPLHLIAWININGTTPTVVNSSTFTITSGTWEASSFSIATVTQCVALGAENFQIVADADQWNFQALTAKVGDSLNQSQLNKLMFLRGGKKWKMRIGINLGSAKYNDLQLSFRDNAATSGDVQGTIPVIVFTGENLTGNIILEVVLKLFGHFSMCLRAIDGSSNKSMFEIEWVVVP